MNTDYNKTVYASETIEFVTVAVEYCVFLENFKEITLDNFIDRLTKLLPLLYLKAQLVPDMADEDLGEVETPVTEDDYNYILFRTTSLIGAYNDYLEVFVQDMQYSDEPILAHIAENLADIYQDLRNFVAVYEKGVEEEMYQALFVCKDNFKLYWGQTLVNVLRPLHSVRYQDKLDSIMDVDPSININDEDDNY